MSTDSRSRFQALRARFSEARSSDRFVLPLGIDAIDARLPGGGLVRGALHEVAGGANGAVDGAAAAAFAAGVAARTGGKVLWCLTQADLFAPALAQSGLTSDRVVFFETTDEKTVLGGFEEALRSGGLSAVVAEIGHLSLKASQRLQFAAETTGTLGIALRRWRRQTDARDFGTPTAASTRWRVMSCQDAIHQPDGKYVRVAGLVLVRQRPGSANGVTFMTIEDETTDMNIIVWEKTGQLYRRILLTSSLIEVSGRIQKEGQVIHLIARSLNDLSPLLPTISQRDIAMTLPHQPGDEFRNGGPSADARVAREAQSAGFVRSRDFR